MRGICYTVLMVKIEIEISRPWLTLGLIAAVMVGSVGVGGGAADALGGLGMRAQVVVKDAEEDARQLRIRQQVLDHQEEILRYQLDLLTRLHAESADGPDEQAIWEARQKLVALLQDKREGERLLLESLQQMWEAQGGAALASAGATGTIAMMWPVTPDEGLSALFDDGSYLKRFGIRHTGDDIPVAQGSTVFAAADGVVVSAQDNGKGFNALMIRHKNGIVTLYGHVSSYLVREGDQVLAGDPVALSGGLPGTPGAGWLTTGPHLHFEVRTDGQPVDPLLFLPPHPMVGD